MSGRNLNSSYDRPSARRRHERKHSYNRFDDTAPENPHEYHQRTPRRHPSNKQPTSSQSRRSTRQSLPRRSRRDSWYEGAFDEFEDDMIEHPPPPRWPPPFHPGAFIGPEDFDPYDYEHIGMLEMGDRMFGPLPPPPHHFFPGLPHPMAGPPVLPPEEYFRHFQDKGDMYDDLSDDGEDYFHRPLPPFLDDFPPPGVLPPLPHIRHMQPPPPPPEFLGLLERSRSLPTRNRRHMVAPTADDDFSPPGPVRRSSTIGPRYRKQPSVRRRANSISTPLGRPRPPMHEPPFARSQVMSVPGSPVELYSPTMEDQFHDALSHQEGDSSSDDNAIPMEWHRRDPPLRRRSLSMLHSRPPPIQLPPLPPLARRHSVFDRRPPSEMIPPPHLMGMPPPPPHMAAATAMRPPPDLAGDHSGGTNNNNSAPGTIWMPASYFTSPSMAHPALPQQQQQQQQHLPPPQMGMMPPPPPFGPTMNPFMMSTFGHPPMSMMPMMGGMFGANETIFGNEGSDISGPPPNNGNMVPSMGPPPMGGFSEGGPSAGPPMIGGGGGPESDDMGRGEPANIGGGGGLPPNTQAGIGGGGGPPSSGLMGPHPSMIIGGGPPQAIMRGGPPVRRKSLFGNLFGNGDGPRHGFDASMFDPNAIIPLQDALGQMSLGGGGGGDGGPMMSSGLPPSSARSLGGGLSRSTSKKVSKKAQELRQFPGLWCYRPGNMMPMVSDTNGDGDREGAGGGHSKYVWAPFSVSNQHKLHRAIDIASGQIPYYTINLDREDNLSGTIYFSPRSGIAQRYRSLLSGAPDIFHVKYIPTHESQFMVRPENMGGGGDIPPSHIGRPAAGGPGMASKLISSVFGT